MIRLYVNVDHVATIREARKTFEPDPLQAALMAESAGAHGITVHLREDRRHIQDHDVDRIRKGISTPMNLEMAPVDEMVEIAIRNRPTQISLVPEKRQEITTEGGLDVGGMKNSLIAIKRKIEPFKIKFSLFVDPVEDIITCARDLGADSIEINTGRYSESDGEELQTQLLAIKTASRHASQLGLKVFAGHGLKVSNVELISAIPEIEELNIGHSLVANSVYVGLKQAVMDMREAIDRGVQKRT